MKDHEIAELVNAITKVANRYHDTSVLREMLAARLVPKLQSLETRNARLTEVLKELVTLKDMKDLNGDSPDYRKRKPLAWERARKTLQE